ncbi:ABC transporter substrate-binding protein [Paulownia witches'-broom phytoplasma]|uniref:ABC transporter substrate-binding protein n=1 Tax=Paulownia witches'-broom phytoplasma TaxID=39647 RepID=A0ABX8TPM7_9MOLU|nr:ABC transporter substrate-binding protein [Paulownia witches'-broom phytoplasma]QYC30998.1 ABC transporter substrate-binding protein [Paulownia witches'-broom phytoplasma]
MGIRQLLQKYKKYLIISGTFFLLSIISFATYKIFFQKQPPRNNFIVIIPNYVNGFDPGQKAHTSNAQGDRLFCCIHSALISTNENGDVLPQVATSWDKVENEDAIIFTLRDDVLFHNGKKLTAQDVKFSFERAKEKGNDEYAIIKSIETLENDTKVKLKLQALPIFVYELIAKYKILSKESLEKDQTHNQLEGLKIGSGPYQLIYEDSSNKIIKLGLFDKYFNKDKIKNSQKEIVFKVNSNYDTSLLQLEEGTVDAILDFPINKITNASNKKNIEVVQNKGAKCSVLFINNNKVKKGKRELIAQTLNIEKIIADLNLPVNPLKTFVPQGEIGHNENIQYAYDSNQNEVKNKVSLLSEKDKEIKLGASFKEIKEVVHKIKEQLQEVGFEVIVNIPESLTFFTNSKNGKYDISFMSNMNEMPYGHKVLIDYMNPIFEKEGKQTPKSHSHIQGDTTLKKLLDKTQTITDKNIYEQTVKDIQTHLYTNKYVVPFYQQNIYFLTSKKVQGLTCDPFTRTDFTQVKVSK